MSGGERELKMGAEADEDEEVARADSLQEIGDSEILDRPAR